MKNYFSQTKIFNTISFVLLCSLSFASHAEQVEITLNLPSIDVSPYHRPYVAVWLETADRKGVTTLAVWHEQEEWLRDMRQWWRKLGRKNPQAYDAVTGATRKPGTYTVRWNSKTESGNPIPPGDYLISVEAAREEGGRDYLRQTVTLGQNQKQHYTLKGKKELGSVEIRILPD